MLLWGDRGAGGGRRQQQRARDGALRERRKKGDTQTLLMEVKMSSKRHMTIFESSFLRLDDVIIDLGVDLDS